MSQTSHEFVRTNERREVYENCDVKCLFYAESVSDQTQQYYRLSSDEIRFIQSAARGQDSNYLCSIENAAREADHSVVASFLRLLSTNMRTISRNWRYQNRERRAESCVRLTVE